jgi:pimeloyl-ACP methyl ester carboxylesterase
MKKRKPLLIWIILFDLLIFALIALYSFSFKETLNLDGQTRSQLPGMFVELPDGWTHYELRGPQDGPPVVLVHGFSVPYYVWDPTATTLADAGYRVLRYDLYGRGFSDRPDKTYDLDFFVKQLDDLTTALLPWQPLHVIGLSMGGPVTAAFANRYPDRVRSLTLIAPETLPVTAMDIFPMNVPLLGEFVMKVYMVPVYLPQSQIEDAFNPAVLPDWEQKYRVQMQYKGFRDALLSTIRHLPEMDALHEYDLVGKTDLPVQIIWGVQDQTISYDALQMALQRIPQAGFTQVDQAGHLPHYEQPSVVNPVLIGFLEGIGLDN